MGQIDIIVLALAAFTQLFADAWVFLSNGRESLRILARQPRLGLNLHFDADLVKVEVRRHVSL